jgi:hypothetical protein
MTNVLSRYNEAQAQVSAWGMYLDRIAPASEKGNCYTLPENVLERRDEILKQLDPEFGQQTERLRQLKTRGVKVTYAVGRWLESRGFKECLIPIEGQNAYVIDPDAPGGREILALAPARN